MSAIIAEGGDIYGYPDEESCRTSKQNHLSVKESPRSPLDSKSSTGESHESSVLDASAEKAYEDVYDKLSSMDGITPRQNFRSESDESGMSSGLFHVAGGETTALATVKRGYCEKSKVTGKEKYCFSDTKAGMRTRAKSCNSKSYSSSRASTEPFHIHSESDRSTKSSPKNLLHFTPDQKVEKNVHKSSRDVNFAKKRRNSFGGEVRLRGGPMDFTDCGVDYSDAGPFLIKRTNELISGNNCRKALEYALRATKSFEKCASGKPNLDLVMSLHVLASIYCSLGRFEEAVPLLERSIEIPVIEQGHDHALAKFAGLMQLGNAYSILGQSENSVNCYSTGLKIQKWALGEKDTRVGETYRHLAEAHMQALQFDEAENLCLVALDIHREGEEIPPLEETADRRLMGLICATKGNHEAALEHLLLASMSMVSINGQEKEMAAVDCSIGDAYLSLARYDEAGISYKKALSAFMSTKGENHPTSARVFVRLADLYNRMGKFRESKAYCERALNIYSKPVTLPVQGVLPEDMASGLTDISAIYVSMNENERAIELLQRALQIYGDAPEQKTTVAGVEAQIGVLQYVVENYVESYGYFKSATEKLRSSAKRKSAFLGKALNYMGLSCVQLCEISEAAKLFEEAKDIFEKEYGAYHPETLEVFSNLAGTYDALGRLDVAINLLEFIVGVREEKLGTANPDVDDEKRRLAELLKEAGQIRKKKSLSLDYLLSDKSHDFLDNNII